MPEPLDKDLYEKAKAKVKRTVKIWPSAYASGQVVQEYKRMGGRYSNPKKRNSAALARWYKEDWRNVCEKTKSGKYKKCGRKEASTNSKDYPYCRPLHRVTKDTPKTIKELSPQTLKRMCSKKKKSMKKSRGRQTRIRLQKSNRRTRSRKSSNRKRKSSNRKSSKRGRRSSKRGSGKTSRKLPSGIKFVRGPYPKKYQAILPNGKKVNFGDQRYEHYKDSVPKNLGGKLWSHLDHRDKSRRSNYRSRHRGSLNRDNVPAYRVKYSPSWFSYHYLW